MEERVKMKLPFSEATLCVYRKQNETLDERGDELIRKYMSAPSSVTQKEVVTLAKDTYQLVVTLFEEKIQQGYDLLPQEKAIYELCKKEVTNDTAKELQLTSIWGAVFNAIETVRNCIDQIAEWLGVSSEKDKAGRKLAEAGNTILPGYASLIESCFVGVAELFIPTFTPTIIGITEAQAECAIKYQESRTVDKTLSSQMLDIANYAYEGHGSSSTGEFVKLAASELPSDIRVLYDESTGLLTSSRGLQVWLGKKDDTIVVSYSGTDPTDVDMLYADAIQLSAPSVLYLKAAGLLNLLLKHIPNKKFYVTGHSLGGGLTQFSVTANMEIASERLQGYGYNPAGLSMISIRHLKDERMEKAKSKIWMFMTCMDMVSAVGGKIGCLTTLPKTDQNGHGIVSLKTCMKKYMEQITPVISDKITISWRNHKETDFIPYTRKLSMRDENGKVYAIFHENPNTSSQEFVTIKMSKNLFEALRFQQTTASQCMGIYNKWNGTAHTVMNRLLLLADNEPMITTDSIGNIHSTMIYGKFGLGIREFIPVLEKAYIDSGESFSGNRSGYEKVLSKINNPFEYEKQAWCEGIRLQFGMDMYEIFRKYPLAESYFDAFLNKVISDRVDIYQARLGKEKPRNIDIRSFLEELKTCIIKNAEELLKEAVDWKVITSQQKENYLEEISDFCDKVIEGISMGMYFNDNNIANGKKRITKIVLHTGWVVDGFQFIYDDIYATPFHGGMGGSRQELKLQNDEWIVSIEGEIGDYQYQGPNTLCSIAIKTNKGHVISGGTKDGCTNLKQFSYKASSGQQIFSLSGEYQGYMKEIRVEKYINV